MQNLLDVNFSILAPCYHSLSGLYLQDEKPDATGGIDLPTIGWKVKLCGRLSLVMRSTGPSGLWLEGERN